MRAHTNIHMRAAARTCAHVYIHMRAAARRRFLIIRYVAPHKLVRYIDLGWELWKTWIQISFPHSFTFRFSQTFICKKWIFFDDKLSIVVDKLQLLYKNGAKCTWWLGLTNSETSWKYWSLTTICVIDATRHFFCKLFV